MQKLKTKQSQLNNISNSLMKKTIVLDLDQLLQHSSYQLKKLPNCLRKDHLLLTKINLYQTKLKMMYHLKLLRDNQYHLSQVLSKMLSILLNFLIISNIKRIKTKLSSLPAKLRKKLKMKILINKQNLLKENNQKLKNLKI